MTSPTTRTLEGADGNALVGDHRGDPGGPGVLFLHGGGQTRHSWGRSADLFASRGFHSVCLDHRGHGDSEWVSDGDYSLNRFAADAGAVVEAVFTEPPALVGASLGGLAAMVLEGVLRPGSISSLVLVDIIPDVDAEGVGRIEQFMAANVEHGFADLQEAADAVAAYNPHRQKPPDPEGLRKNLRQGPDGRWRWHWDPAFMRRAGEKDPGGEFADAELLHYAVDAIAVPMQLVRGQRSDIVSAEGARQFLERYPHIEFVDVTDASHMVAGDRNDAFTAAVAAFLT